VILTHKNGASFYRFESLARFSEIRHGIFTRHFGCSNGPFESLNVSFGLGDKAAQVRENRRVIARAMGSNDLIFAQQVHGDRVLILNADNFVCDEGSEPVAGTGDALVMTILFAMRAPNRLREPGMPLLPMLLGNL
jgi:copper oxidase (laccase) domain-containing protein